MPRLPAVFFAHGSPMVAIEQDPFTEAVRRFGAELPRPKAIVVVSAHWEAPGAVRVTAGKNPPLIYDFSGFPDELYLVRYPSPGDPALATEIVSRLSGVRDDRRGIDHGAWVPVRHAFPSADIPLLEVSLPVPRTPARLVAMGKALAPLRDEGVLLVGSGGIVHNLRRVRFDDKQAPVDGWARDFDLWVKDRVEPLDVGGLMEYEGRAPQAALAVPTSEHFDPMFFVLGAAQPGDRVTWLHEGFHHGNLSMRSFLLS